MTLRLGSTGPEVRAWQQRLGELGYAVAIDGDYGPRTEDATRAFQVAAGLSVDGIAGPLTQAAAAAVRPAAPPPAAPSSGRLSARGRELIKGFEGLRLTAYEDGRNADGSPRYSIGYGHNGASKGQQITRAEADRLFDADVLRFELAVAEAAPRAAQHEFDAMVSLAYNIGAEAFRKSTVAARHNRGDTHGAADAFEMWNQSGGRVLAVLERRRERERDVYLHGHAGAVTPPPPPPSVGASALPLLLALGGGAALLWMSQRGRRAA